MKDKLKTIATVAAIVVCVALALAVIAFSIVAAPFVIAIPLWLAWTYLGLGSLFTTLPLELQQLGFSHIFAGCLAWYFLVLAVKSPFMGAASAFLSLFNSQAEKRTAKLSIKKSSNA